MYMRCTAATSKLTSDSAQPTLWLLSINVVVDGDGADISAMFGDVHIWVQQKTFGQTIYMSAWHHNRDIGCVTGQRYQGRFTDVFTSTVERVQRMGQCGPGRTAADIRTLQPSVIAISCLPLVSRHVKDKP